MILPERTQGLNCSVDAERLVLVTRVIPALGTDGKTEKEMLREYIKAIKSNRMPRIASQVLMLSPSKCFFTHSLGDCVFVKRLMGERTGLSPVSFLFGKVCLCFKDGHRKVIVPVSLAVLTKICVATSV